VHASGPPGIVAAALRKLRKSSAGFDLVRRWLTCSEVVDLSRARDPASAAASGMDSPHAFVPLRFSILCQEKVKVAFALH
jgi:hypothetical protein